jgi:hypothetical protein
MMIEIVSLASVAVCALLCNLKTFEMVDRVNQKLATDKQFNWLWWDPSKHQRLWREYKRLYPTGSLLLHIRILMALGFAGLLISAWASRFFAK